MAVFVCHVGADAPFEVNICPVVPAAVIANAEPVEYTAPPLTAVKFALEPPFANGSIPVTPVVRGSPVAFVNTAEATVPNGVALPEASKLTDFSAGYATNTF